MREILFRGKRIGDGEWVEGNLMTGTWYLDNRPITAISPVDDVFYPHYETSGYEEVITETVNDGYCPCAIERTEDTRCMCKEFREMDEGECHCGRYRKEK